jgi:hypothetical protein
MPLVYLHQSVPDTDADTCWQNSMVFALLFREELCSYYDLQDAAFL